MNYRYRVKGVADKAFILRGMHFRIGGEINIVILESELAFVKERCALENIEDLSTLSQPIPNNSNTTPKGVKNELPKSTSRTNKSKSKATV
jgi:hypothetical protein